MNDAKLLDQIGDLIDTKLKPIKTQLDVVENKVENANEKIDVLDKRISNVETKVGVLDEKIESLNRKIEIVIKKVDKAQEETIETLSELITSGHSMHEKRIKRIEDHLQLPQIQ